MITQTYSGKIGVKAEYDKLRVATVFSPGDEIRFARLHYKSALYKDSVNLSEAIKEHKQLVDVIKSYDVEVIDLRSALQNFDSEKLQNILVQMIHCVPINNDNSLREDGLSETTQNNEVLRESVKNLTKEELLGYILEQPLIFLRPGDVPDYKIRPLSNILFARDQFIVTDKGVVLGKMRMHQRNDEVELVGKIFDNLSLKPKYRIVGTDEDSYLEGGDYIPCGDFALIGCGLRSDKSGIEQLLWNKQGMQILGFDEIAIINYKNQSMVDMHLDTWLNILNKESVVVLEDLLESDKVKIEVWIKKEDGYERNQDIVFQNLKEYLNKKGIKNFIKINRDEQKNFAPNFLTIDQNRIICVKNSELSDLYARIKKVGISCNEISMPNLTNMYGACHCLTNALFRSEERERYVVDDDGFDRQVACPGDE